MPYIEYISTILDLYASICVSRNIDGIKRVKDLGLSHEMLINCLSNKNIHERFKTSLIKLARVLFIDCDPFP